MFLFIFSHGGFLLDKYNWLYYLLGGYFLACVAACSVFIITQDGDKSLSKGDYVASLSLLFFVCICYKSFCKSLKKFVIWDGILFVLANRLVWRRLSLNQIPILLNSKSKKKNAFSISKKLMKVDTTLHKQNEEFQYPCWRKNVSSWLWRIMQLVESKHSVYMCVGGGGTWFHVREITQYLKS